MTILHALAKHHERLEASGRAPPYGYSRERISYGIVLSCEGELVDVTPLIETQGKTPRPREMSVPQTSNRSGTTPRSFYLWDKTAYVLGVKRDAQTNETVTAQREHETFKKLHENLLAGTDDEGLQALLEFLRRWQPGQHEELRHGQEMLNTNVVFRLKTEQSWLHERAAAKTIWGEHLAATDQPQRLCLVTGKRGAIARVHPNLKGIRGAQSSGASIVSFNLEAFESQGKSQGENAPVSVQAAFAYTSALNALTAFGSRQRVGMADTTVVFWAEAADEAHASAAEDIFAMLMTEPKTDEEEGAAIGAILTEIANGKPIESAKPDIERDTRFYVLGLGPNAARVSVRFWHADTIGRLGDRVAQHWRDLQIEPSPWRAPPAPWRLLRETAAGREGKNISPTLSGALLRSILLGERYPRTLLANIITRIRADKIVNGERAAICRACLARDYRLGFEKEDAPMSLNLEETSAAYRLGRLFAVYEGAQRAAIGKVNATIKDRYFGAASSTPASVFPLLERNANHHLATLRKSEKGGLAHWFEREIDAILDGVETSFPRSLPLEQQGRFTLGYHHQRATKRNTKEGSVPETDNLVKKED